MKRIHSYIIKEILLFFTISLLTFTGILLTLRMLKFATLVIDRGVALSQIIAVFISLVPTFLEIAVPLACLLGILLALARLSGDSEIIVMKASGISIFQIAYPVVLFGLAVSLSGVAISHYLKPWGHKHLAEALFEIARSRSTSGLEQGIFNKLGNLTLYAEGISHSDGGLNKVLIDDRRNAAQKKVVVSRSGQILSDEENRQIILLLKQGVIHEIIDGKYFYTNFEDNELSLNPDELFEQSSYLSGRNVAEMTGPELRERMDYLERLLPITSEDEVLDVDRYLLPIPKSVFAESTTRAALVKRIRRTEIEQAQRWSLPFASLVLALLAVPLGIQPPRAHRSWGAGLSVSLGLLVFVLYYGLFSVGIVAAQNGTLPAYACVWLPNVAVLILGAALLNKTGSEQWSSVATRIQEVLLSSPLILKRLRFS